MTERCYPTGEPEGGYYGSHDPLEIWADGTIGPVEWICHQCGRQLYHIEVYFPWNIPVWQWVTQLRIVEWP